MYSQKQSAPHAPQSGTADESIMYSQTRHSRTTCLSRSDLAGVHALYPICDGQISQTPSCTKVCGAQGEMAALTAHHHPHRHRLLFPTTSPTRPHPSPHALAGMSRP